MIIVVFRSRLRPDLGEDYLACTNRMWEIVQSLPRFNSAKGYTADDGEKVSIHEWESAEHLRAWEEHLEAKDLGRRHFYEDYSCYICDQPREYHYPA